MQSTLTKAPLGKRFLALAIDWLLMILVSLIPFVGGVIGCAYILLRDGLNLPFMTYRSIGKQLMGLDVVVLAGPAKNYLTSAKRNWMLALPAAITIVPYIGIVLSIPLATFVFLLEGTRVITDPAGRRFGDLHGNTQVVKVAPPTTTTEK